jgi:hypothetical protein
MIETVAANAGREINQDTDVEDSTGPRLLTRLFYSLPESERRKIKILAQIYWLAPTIYPNLWPVNIKMFARHHFLGTWKNQRRRPGWQRRWRERSLWPNPWAARYHEFAN